MKVVLTLLMLLGFAAIKDTDVPGFELVVTYYNHAARVMDGTMIYDVTDDSITVSKHYISAEEDILLFKGKVSSSAVEKIKALKLGQLQELYFNRCILPTSGNEYFIALVNGDDVKKIHLHHYYKEEFSQLTELININLPEEYQIDYLEKDTQQDCN